MSTSETPADSTTARTGPPAITPVPGEAGCISTRPAPEIENACAGAELQVGREQAERCAAALAGKHFDAFYVSPLARTRATAAAILACQPDAPALMAEPCDWLREIDHGPDENQDEDAVIARIGAEALAAWDAHGVAPRDWQVDAESRLAAWHAFLATAPGPALLVTSNGAARFALLAIGAVADRPLKLATGAYGVICRDADGTLRVESWNVRP